MVTDYVIYCVISLLFHLVKERKAPQVWLPKRIKMSYQGYQERMFELKVKVANAESLLAVAEKLSDKSGMIACRQIIVETRCVLQSMGPLIESVQRLGNALRQQADAARRSGLTPRTSRPDRFF